MVLCKVGVSGNFNGSFSSIFLLHSMASSALWRALILSLSEQKVKCQNDMLQENCSVQ